MKKKIIKITYRHFIDASSASGFDKAIFDITRQEFLLKSQAYNRDGSLDSFIEMKKADGRANSLHYKIALAASGIMDSLQGANPFVVDYSGKNIEFEDYRFELLESSVNDKRKHCLAIYFVSSNYILHEISGHMLLLSKEQAAKETDEMYNTFMLTTEKNLYVSNYKEVILQPVRG